MHVHYCIELSHAVYRKMGEKQREMQERDKRGLYSVCYNRMLTYWTMDYRDVASIMY